MKKLNERKKADIIMAFDFPTLYTKIPLKKLFNVIHESIVFCVGGCNTYFSVTKYVAQ